MTPRQTARPSTGISCASSRDPSSRWRSPCVTKKSLPLAQVKEAALPSRILSSCKTRYQEPRHLPRRIKGSQCNEEDNTSTRPAGIMPHLVRKTDLGASLLGGAMCLASASHSSSSQRLCTAANDHNHPPSSDITYSVYGHTLFAWHARDLETLEDGCFSTPGSGNSTLDKDPGFSCESTRGSTQLHHAQETRRHQSNTIEVKQLGRTTEERAWHYPTKQRNSLSSAPATSQS